MAEPTPTELPGPVYRDLGEAADDPDLDMSKPFFVAPDPIDSPPESADWSGWSPIGATTDEG